MKIICNEKCSSCPIISHYNNRMLTKILNEAYKKFGKEFYYIVQKNCPNMTGCYNCHIDDFCHLENCDLVKE